MENQDPIPDEDTARAPTDSVPSPTSLYGSTFPSFGFSEKTKKTDLTLIVGGKNVYVTRAVLELTSPTFQTLLEVNEDTPEIELDKDVSEFVEFLACFYPGKGHNINKENVFKMLPLADEYGIVHVINQCETCLQSLLYSSETESDVFLSIVSAVYGYNLVNLKPECLKALERRSLDEILKTGDADNISIEARADMYSSLLPRLISDALKYKFLYVGITKKKALKLDELQEVDYFTLTMSMKADLTGEQNSETFEKVGKLWSIKTCRYWSNGALGIFSVSVLCEPNQKTTSDSSEGLLNIVVKNNIPWKDNVMKKLEFVVKPERFTTQHIRIEDPSVYDKEAGFLMDKRYTIEAHILLSKGRHTILNN